ncbi:MAG: glycine zipper 2TM domain-containing protein [Gammaproteobacteria bacterium]|nr:glycine zipper 2TM domain-containing protein [Gammaproteobacteria bacterium]MBU1980276.1 glycine zipper 2TM domain-containing protein [Gammaproteobacteria bacterium]
MHKLFTFAIAATTGLTGLATAADFTDAAPVISSTPIYRQISEPRQDCWTETVSSAPVIQEKSYGGAVIGGLAGALLGSQVGQGNGRTAAAAVGAATGALVGDRMGNPAQADVPRQVQRCREIETSRQELSGYNVVYRFHGRDITTTLPYDPGSYVRLGVNVLGAGS